MHVFHNCIPARLEPGTLIFSSEWAWAEQCAMADDLWLLPCADLGSCVVVALQMCRVDIVKTLTLHLWLWCVTFDLKHLTCDLWPLLHADVWSFAMVVAKTYFKYAMNLLTFDVWPLTWNGCSVTLDLWPVLLHTNAGRLTVVTVQTCKVDPMNTVCYLCLVALELWRLTLSCDKWCYTRDLLSLTFDLVELGRQAVVAVKTRPEDAKNPLTCELWVLSVKRLKV